MTMQLRNPRSELRIQLDLHRFGEFVGCELPCFQSHEIPEIPRLAFERQFHHHDRFE
jgi:hypothetical protein